MVLLVVAHRGVDGGVCEHPPAIPEEVVPLIHALDGVDLVAGVEDEERVFVGDPVGDDLDVRRYLGVAVDDEGETAVLGERPECVVTRRRVAGNDTVVVEGVRGEVLKRDAVERGLRGVGDEVLVPAVCSVIGVVCVLDGARDGLLRHPVDERRRRRGAGEVRAADDLYRACLLYDDGCRRAGAPGGVCDREGCGVGAGFCVGMDRVYLSRVGAITKVPFP